jgi:hypothetical protein
MRSRRAYLALATIATLPVFAGCGAAEPTAIGAGSHLDVTFHGLRPLDAATEGSYEAWLTDETGTVTSAGRFVLPVSDATGASSVRLTVASGGVTRLAVTVEPPGDNDVVPSRSELMAGSFSHGAAALSILGSVTDGRPLETDPGHHSLFTSSNNVELGYPSFENSGLWLFSISVLVNKHGTREVKVTPLQRGWTYEGWIVRKPGTPDEVWLPYGKFVPDQLGLLTSRDNEGSGVFSGDADYVNGGVEDVPGGEWTTTRVSNQLGLSVPGGLTLPLALDAVDSTTSEAVWYHVISIEPIADEDEPMLTDRPFLLRPYRNPIGAGGPGVPRLIVYQHNDPYGDARVVP